MKTAKEPKTQPQPAAPARKPGKKFADGDVITAIATNYKRPTSDAFRRYALYREGMTVGEFLAAGGKWADILWDARESNRYITIKAP